MYGDATPLPHPSSFSLLSMFYGLAFVCTVLLTIFHFLSVLLLPFVYAFYLAFIFFAVLSFVCFVVITFINCKYIFYKRMLITVEVYIFNIFILFCTFRDSTVNSV